MKKIFYVALGLSIALQSCEKDIKSVPDGYTSGVHEIPAGEYVSNQNFKIVAYYAIGNAPDSIELAKYKMITHLHFAFAYPKTDGTITALASPANFAKVIALAKENGVKTAVSFSGSEAIYSAVAADPSIRTKLVDNIVDFALKNNLDGIDIDWEYPRANYSNDITFELFMQELSGKLHKYHKYLSAAVTAGLYAGNVRDGITQGAIEACDFVNLMAYDGSGWGGDPNHSSYKIAEDVLDVWYNLKGLPKEKAVLGVPNYGKTTGGTAMTYRNLLINGADAQQNIFSTGTSIYYYNGIQLMKEKAVLAKEEANGIMFWELYQDANGDKSLIKAVNDTLGRVYQY